MHFLFTVLIGGLAISAGVRAATREPILAQLLTGQLEIAHASRCPKLEKLGESLAFKLNLTGDPDPTPTCLAMERVGGDDNRREMRVAQRLSARINQMVRMSAMYKRITYRKKRITVLVPLEVDPSDYFGSSVLTGRFEKDRDGVWFKPAGANQEDSLPLHPLNDVADKLRANKTLVSVFAPYLNQDRFGVLRIVPIKTGFAPQSDLPASCEEVSQVACTMDKSQVLCSGDGMGFHGTNLCEASRQTWAWHCATSKTSPADYRMICTPD